MASESIIWFLYFCGFLHQGHSRKSVIQTILDNAPWRIKLMMLRYIDKYQTDDLLTRRIGIDSEEGLDDHHLTSPMIERRQDYMPTTVVFEDDDDSNMKLKLFRLMYETVKDIDLKVKRAEMIRNKRYVKSEIFDAGYIMSKIDENYEIMKEIGRMMVKFNEIWLPTDHMSGLDHAILVAKEITSLVNILHSMNKQHAKHELYNNK